jgi:hypothetical protein
MISLKALSLALVTAAFLHSANAQADEASYSAADLYDPEHREEAIRALKAAPHLEEQLAAALRNPDLSRTAAHVIVALGLKSMARELVAAAKEDASGRMFLSVLELDPAGENPAVREAIAFEARSLGLPRQAPATTVALLDRLPTLALSPSTVSRLLAHPSFEVRIALALRLLDSPVVERGVVSRLLSAKPYQVRWEAIASLSARRGLDPQIRSSIREQCAKESREEFRVICRDSLASRIWDTARAAASWITQEAIAADGVPPPVARPVVQGKGRRKKQAEAFAAPDVPDSASESFKHVLARDLEIFTRVQSSLRFEAGNTIGGVCQAGVEPARQNFCLKRYASLNDKPKLSFDVFSGYQNFGSETADPGERAAWAEWLTMPCHGDSKVCGFERDADDADTFYKDVEWAPGGSKRIEFHLHNASETSNNARNERSPTQAAKTAEQQRQFAKALRESDLVFYTGHSRYGGGPDFAPEKRRPDGRWDIGYYKQNRPGLKLMDEALKDRKDGSLFLLGLLSCDSKKHFETNVDQIPAVDRTLLSTHLVPEDGGFDEMIAVFEGVLHQTCGPLMNDDSLFQLRVRKSIANVDDTDEKNTAANTCAQQFGRDVFQGVPVGCRRGHRQNCVRAASGALRCL